MPERVRRAVTAGGPAAAITAGIGVGATGVAGPGIETRTGPVARQVADAVGMSPQFGPALLILAAFAVVILAFVAPGLFREQT
jgi:hypothetical protein